jgi:ATP synthase F1 delta subunit
MTNKNVKKNKVKKNKVKKNKIKKNKVRKNKVKKKTTNYKKLGAAGLGGTILGTLATRGIFDRKQLLKVKEMNEKFAKYKESKKNECEEKLKFMETKYDEKFKSWQETVNKNYEIMGKKGTENKLLKKENKKLETDLNKLEEKRQEWFAKYRLALDYIKTEGGEEAYKYFISGDWKLNAIEFPGTYLNVNRDRESFGQTKFSKKQLMTMLSNKKISKKQLLTMLISSIVSGGATRVYSKKECDRRIREIYGTNVPGSIPRQKNKGEKKYTEREAKKLSEQAQEENMFLKKENEKLREKIEMSKLTNNFIGVIVKKNRVKYLLEIINSFDDLLSNLKGEKNATISSAKDLSEKEIKDIKSQLKDKFNSDFNIKIIVDKSLIGGLKIQVGSQMIDSSIKNQLQLLKEKMKEVA